MKFIYSNNLQLAASKLFDSRRSIIDSWSNRTTGLKAKIENPNPDVRAIKTVDG